MPVSFIDLVPQIPTATVIVEGQREIELSGVRLRDLAEISRRFPDFAKMLDGGLGSILDSPDALAAMIAASVGHPGDAECEKLAAQYPIRDAIRMWVAISQLTFPRATADPLAEGVNGVDATASDLNSPQPSND